jgi:hypothetical protein
VGSLSESLVAWLLLPALLFAVALGLGLLATRLARFEAPNALLPPIGLCVALVIGMPAYRLDAGAPVAAVIVVGAALAGFLLSRRELRARLAPGPAGVAALAVFALYLAPVALSGGWTWSGYNFVNDTALQLQLVDHLADDGFEHPTGQDRLETASTSDAAVYFYLRAYYPIGAHALLATLGALIPADYAALYQPFLATLCALAAMAVAVLVRRLDGRPLVAAGVAVVALAANLLYVYALQGNIKEVAAFATLAAAAAVGRELLDRVTAGGAALFAICLTAILAVFSSAGAPFVLALGATVLAVALVRPPEGDRRRLLRPALVGAATLALASLLAATELVQSFRVVSETFGAPSGGELRQTDAGAAPNELGHLLRALPLPQMAGVWLGGDYRVPVAPGAELANAVLIGAVWIAAALGVAWAWVRREGGPLLLLVPTLAAVLVVGPRVSPYAEAKLLAIGSPAIVLMAAIGVLAVARFVLPHALAAAAVLAGGVLLSDAYAYHSVQLAPIDRMQAMEDVAERYRGRGELLVAEGDEFVKYFFRDTAGVSEFDPVSPRQVQLRQRQPFVGRPFDLDDQTLHFIESFQWIVQRIGPDASRAPANFTLDYQNRFYRVWRRGPRPKVVEHAPLKEFDQPTAVPDCSVVSGLARRARRSGGLLVAARRPSLILLEPREARRSAGWVLHPFTEGAVVTQTPGTATRTAAVPAGRYRVWIQGSFGRDVAASVGGRRVGAVKGVNTAGGWHLVGEATSAGGRERLELSRGGGGLSPGDGFQGALGPLALEPVARESLRRVRPADARTLCGRRWDWIERIAPPGGG